MAQVINFWFQLLQESSAASVDSGKIEKPCHFFNSFFYSKVSENGYNYRNVRRWTRKVLCSSSFLTIATNSSLIQVDLFGMDKIFVPVNFSNVKRVILPLFLKLKVSCDRHTGALQSSSWNIKKFSFMTQCSDAACAVSKHFAGNSLI